MSRAREIAIRAQPNRIPFPRILTPSDVKSINLNNIRSFRDAEFPRVIDDAETKTGEAEDGGVVGVQYIRDAIEDNFRGNRSARPHPITTSRTGDVENTIHSRETRLRAPRVMVNYGNIFVPY